MFEGFVHPALVAGVGLATVPLVIHLLNRQRYRPVRWAAMRFVLAAYRKTRRRVQLENLLLLLLRMAAVALLALAVARPFASGDSPLAGLTESRRDVVLVLDGSASTGYREDVETVFERIVERCGEIVAKLNDTKGDRVQLILAGAYPRLVAWTSPQKAISVLSTMTAPTDERLDLPAALGEVLRLVEEDAAGGETSALEVRLLTDMQRSVFDVVDPAEGLRVPGGEQDPTAEGRERPLLLEQLDALDARGVRILVEDFGPTPTVPNNLAVEALTVLQPNLGVDVPIDVAVSIVNHGRTPQPAVRVALYVDDERRPVQRVDVAAGGRAEAVFSLQFSEPGAHALRAELDGDKLAVDDARSNVVSVPPRVRVLVVNGARADRFEDDETGYLMAVLEPPDESSFGIVGPSPFDPREITPDLLGSSNVDFADYDLIVLANVGNVSARVVAALEERVAAGASLLITVGDRMGDLSGFNDRLYRADGTGLLPAQLARKVSASRRDNYYRVGSFDERHPALEFFSDVAWKPLLTEVPIYDFLTTRGLLEVAKVLASLDDEAKSPLLIERAYDRGRVFLWTTTIGRAWTRIPESPKTLIPLVHELVRYAGRRREPPRNVEPGGSVRLELAGFPRSPELVRPDGSRRTIDGEPTETRSGRWSLPVIEGEDTLRVGSYRVELEGERPEPFAVQLDPAESDLARISAAELAGLHPALEPLARGETRKRGDDDGPRRGEVWRLLALLCLCALVAESLWAAWLGQRRSVKR